MTRSQVVAARDIAGPKPHDLERVRVEWLRDGSVCITFPHGTGPVDLDTRGVGNFRKARFTVRRRQFNA